MRMDDRAADGQPHAHSVALRGEEWFEDPSRISEPAAAVGDLDGRGITSAARTYIDDHRVILVRLHRLHAVTQNIENQLLNLNSVDLEQRKRMIEIQHV